MAMEPATLETYRQRLLRLQQQVVQRIFGREEAMYTMDADRDIERMDRIQEEVAEVALTALEEQERQEMAEVQAALARIEAGTYGVCEACGEAINPARLEAFPMARHCVHCQERVEKRRKE
jgi:DnaK suppressor protein